jgi:CubicO group peptidase (beta-lactamase class C family)
MHISGMRVLLTAILTVAIGLGPTIGLAQEAQPAAALPAAEEASTAQPAPAPPTASRRWSIRRAVARPASTGSAAMVAPPVAAAPPVSAAPMDPAQLAAFIDGVVTETMIGQKVAGVSVSVVQNGQVVFKRGYGFDSLSPARRVDPDRTLFRLASISKTFTWIAVMRQVEAGRIRLDAPVNLYLPESVKVPDQGFEQQVRVIDLMNHRPGFEDRALGQLFEKDARRVRPAMTWLKQERPRREWPAGSVPAYSNYGVGLAGEAVAWQAQRPFEQVMEQDITRPLGMNRTTFRDVYPPRSDLPAPMPAFLAGDVSKGYFWTGSRFVERPYEFVSQVAAAGGGSSTASDMARYMMLLLNGGTLDGVTLYNAQTAAGFRTVDQRALPGAGGFARGFIEYRLPGGRTGYGHDGATLSFRSNMTVVPDLGLGVFVAVNTETGGALTRSLAERIVQRFYTGGQAEQPPVRSQWLEANRAAFTGEYLTSRRSFHGMEKFIGLINGRTKVTVDEQGQLVIQGFNSSSVWTPVNQSGLFRSVSDARQIAFEMKNGRATGFYDANGATFSQRVGLLGGQGLMVWLALLALVASISTLVGSGLRLRLNLRQTTAQARGSMIQTIQAVLWVVAFASTAIWTSRSGDVAAIFFDWPGGLLLTASACGFVSAILSVVVILLTPFIWQGGRRVDSFTFGRKLRFTATAVIFLIFSALLATWGAIFPWAS